MLLHRILTALACATVLSACSVNSGRAYQHSWGAPEATSLLGRSLNAMPIDAETKLRYAENLAAAERAYTADPHDELAIIWLGRRTAYLGRYQEAITIYSEGLRVYPFSPRLLRHRGHRYLSTRQISQAIDDLNRAARLIAGHPDHLEPDGLPNAQNKPRSTTHGNIWYHLALAYYVDGQFSRAADAWQRAFDVAVTDDSRVAAGYWRHLALVRAGRVAEADAELDWVRPDLDVIENHSYLRLWRLFAGQITADEVTGGPSTVGAAVDDATVAYGLGAWHLINGRSDEAFTFFEAIEQGPAWPAFGHLAAEAELAGTTLARHAENSG